MKIFGFYARYLSQSEEFQSVSLIFTSVKHSFMGLYIIKLIENSSWTGPSGIIAERHGIESWRIHFSW